MFQIPVHTLARARFLPSARLGRQRMLSGRTPPTDPRALQRWQVAQEGRSGLRDVVLRVPRAADEDGRLPTTTELRAWDIDVGYDQWTPVTAHEQDVETGRRYGVRYHAYPSCPI